MTGRTSPRFNALMSEVSWNPLVRAMAGIATGGGRDMTAGLTGRGAAVMTGGTTSCCHTLMRKLCGPRIGTMTGITTGGCGNMRAGFARGGTAVVTGHTSSRFDPLVVVFSGAPSCSLMTRIAGFCCR